MTVLVIGESCMDVFTYGECNRLCPEAPVPVFNPLYTVENGGMAKNVHNNLYSLRVKSRLLTNENYQKVTKTRFIDHRTNHMFMRLDKNDGFYGQCDVRNINFNSYETIIISDYNKGFLTEQDITYIADNHKSVFLDTKKLLGPWCKSIKYIKINGDEYERSKHLIDEQIFDKLIITLGPEGAKHKNVIYPVPKVEIKDTSGAGDTFVAGLVCGFMKNKNIEDSINFANECATKVVQRKGVVTL